MEWEKNKMDTYAKIKMTHKKTIHFFHDRKFICTNQHLLTNILKFYAFQHINLFIITYFMLYVNETIIFSQKNSKK